MLGCWFKSSGFCPVFNNYFPINFLSKIAFEITMDYVFFLSLPIFSFGVSQMFCWLGLFLCTAIKNSQHKQVDFDLSFFMCSILLLYQMQKWLFYCAPVTSVNWYSSKEVDTLAGKKSKIIILTPFKLLNFYLVRVRWTVF